MFLRLKILNRTQVISVFIVRKNDVLSCVIVDIEVEGGREVILFSLSPGMCLWGTVNKLEHKYLFCSLVQDYIAHRQTNQQKTYVSLIFMCRPRLYKCRSFSDNLFIIVIVLHNFSFVTHSYTVPINCWGYWMTVVAWVVHKCLVFKPNIAPGSAHASKNCSVGLICEKYLECEGCHIAD